jgi:V-type H+-transporting ATPase subunit C
MTEFWFVSVPGESNPHHVFERVNKELSQQNSLASCWKFNVPNDLKVGTLDILVGLSDELGKLDAFADSVVHKVAHYMGEILEIERSQLPDNLRVNGEDPSVYITKFSWDNAKYPPRQTLRGLFDVISEQITKIDSELKAKSHQYNSLKNSLQSLERKQVGSLLTRNLGDIVKKEHFVHESEYLTTLVVAVPKSLFHEWRDNYEQLCDMVAPRSSELITEDADYGLFTVTLFQKKVDEFKGKCRENKFVVREFSYKEDEIEASKNELSKLAADKKKQFGPLFRWLKVNFGEVFSAMIHVKALRVFVESVLRYGLPVNFQGILIRPNKKSIKRVRDTLDQMFKHLDNVSMNMARDLSDEISNLNLTGMDYYPYVFYKLVIDFV